MGLYVILLALVVSFFRRRALLTDQLNHCSARFDRVNKRAITHRRDTSMRYTLGRGIDTEKVSSSRQLNTYVTFPLTVLETSKGFESPSCLSR